MRSPILLRSVSVVPSCLASGGLRDSCHGFPCALWRSPCAIWSGGLFKKMMPVLLWGPSAEFSPEMRTGSQEQKERSERGTGEGSACDI